MQERVDITIENQIAHVRMVRSDKMNALDNDMMEAMIAAGERLKNEAGLRAIVLSVKGAPFVPALIWAISAQRRTSGSGEKVTRKPLAERTHGKPICRKKLPASGAKSGCPLLRRAWFYARRRLSNFHGRRHTLCRAGHEIFNHGNQMGSGTRYGHHPCYGALGTRRYFEGTRHDRAHL